VIAHLYRARDTAGTLNYLFGPGRHARHGNPRLIAGDCHGAPIEMLAQADALPYLAHALNAPVERLGTRAPDRPVWICSVRSDPHRADLSDAQWGEVASRVVAATGLAPDGDPDACRWIALRNQPRRVHVVTTLAREDGRLHHAYRDAFHAQKACDRIAAELGHMPTTPSTPRTQEPVVPAPFVTVTIEPSGSVSAKGATDDLSAAILKHAGFQQIQDWYGRRHRLPTTTPAADRAAIATHAAEMLRAARYSVDLDPGLDTSRITTPTDPHGVYLAGAQVLQLTDQIKGAATPAAALHAVDQLLNRTDGVLVRLGEALEATGEQITDLDSDAYPLADRFAVASEFISAAEGELIGALEELRALDHSGQVRGDSHQAKAAAYDATAVISAAQAASPAATRAAALSSAAPASPAPSPAAPGQGPWPRPGGAPARRP